ncbi:MAG: LPS-assembly protein LptD [Alcanivoracaceae bacterium]|jgi:LPS-assembly protein|nr:LPS-assembly protein LptD [Alcanivoracaceae bacterium]
MPLRLTTTLLISALLAGPVLADDLNWVKRKEMKSLPEELQRPIPAWCSGTYYNPELSSAPASGDTLISAERSEFEIDGDALLEGTVIIEQPGRTLRADVARYNQSSGDFALTGDIQLDTATLSFRADSLTGNMKNREASLLSARYALYEQNARGDAQRINQSGELVTIERGSYTTCAPGSDGWRLNARQIDLDRERGWGEARHVVLRVENVPLLYIPWITFPIDDRRKTGLLFPSFGTSDSGGFDVSQPLYLNLHPQADATLAPRYIDGRGNGIDTEFRYLTRLGQGDLVYGLLRQDTLFAEEDRVVASWNHQGSLDRWLFSTDVNYVSDDFYFKDLDTGLEVASLTHLPREGQAEYFGRRWRFLARLQAWQTIDPTLDDDDLPYRRLPQLNITGLQPIAGPLTLDWASDITVFDRDVSVLTNDIRGQRIHLQPALSVPLEKPWGYLHPRVRFYQTAYSLSGVDTLPSDTPNRSLWGANLDGGLFLERPIAIAGRQLLQTLEPRIFLNHIEQEEQFDLPDFDSGRLTSSWDTLFRENRFTGYDRIGDEQSGTVGLTSRFRDPQRGDDLLTVRAAQKFHHQDRVVESGNIDQPDNTLSQSPLVADATLQLDQRWSMFAETQWNSEKDRREQNSLRIAYSDRSRLHLHAGYQYRPQDAIRQTELAAMVPVHRNWSLIGRWLHDLGERRSLETVSGIEYRDCCWRIRLVNLRELSDLDGDETLDSQRTTLLQIQMVGLGGFGGTVDTLLERGIPGYRRTQ